MAIERRWPAVPPVAFTASGTSRGKATIASTRGFKVKQRVTLIHPTLGRVNFEVKRVTSRYTLELGSENTKIDDRSDISAFDTTTVIFANEQPQAKPTDKEIALAVYDQEPTVAYRSVPVDQFGDYYDTDNRLPVDIGGNLSVDNLNVQLTAHDNDPNPGDVHDSIRIGDGTNEVSVNSDGSINVNVVQSISSSTPGLTITHNEVSSVAAGLETTLISMVAPPSGLRISKIELSGENIALFRVKVDGNTIGTKRTWWTAFNAEFVYEDVSRGLLLTSGETLTVTVFHNRPSAANFEVTIITE